MLALGQDLYNLTTRDLETLLCEPFFRTNTGTIGAGVSGLDLFFNVPRDRCLYLHTVSWEVDPGVAQTTNQIQLHISNPDASARQVWWNLRGVLSGDYNPVANPGVMVGFNLKPGILLPPGAVLGTTVVKSNAANAGGYNIRVGGYLVPPGRIGRVFWAGVIGLGRVNKGLAQAVREASRTFASAVPGLELVVVSGYRSTSHQARLVSRYAQGDRDGFTSRPAIHSAHTAGRAVDLAFRYRGRNVPTAATPDAYWQALASILSGAGIIRRGLNHFEVPLGV